MPHNLETESSFVLEAQARLLERRRQDQEFKNSLAQNPLAFENHARALGLNLETINQIRVNLGAKAAPRTYPIALEDETEFEEKPFRTENVKPAATVSRSENGKLDITLDLFEQSFCRAERIAFEQYLPYEKALGRRLFSFAVRIRAICLLFNEKAKPNATLCGMIPFNVLAAVEGTSASYMYRIAKENEMFQQLIHFDGWVSDYWIAKPSSDGQEAKAHRANGGTLFVSRAAPVAGSTPKARGFDWQRTWRDMADDVSDGRTAGKLIEEFKKIRATQEEKKGSHTYTHKSLKSEIQMLKHFYHLSLPIFIKRKSVENVCEPALFEAVTDALDAPIPTRGNARAEWCDRLASAICHALNDGHSQKGWLAAAWTVAKSCVYGIGPAKEIMLGAIYDVMVRLYQGQTVKKAGGLARHLMNLNGWADLEAATAGLSLGRSKSER